MQPRMSPVRFGVAFGTMIGGLHLGWAALVATGNAQPLLDLVFALHSLRPSFQVTAFDPRTAATLVAFTAGAGFGLGVLVAAAWNAALPKLRHARV